MQRITILLTALWLAFFPVLCTGVSNAVLILGTGALTLFALFTFPIRERLTCTWTDLLALAWLGWEILNMLLIRHGAIDPAIPVRITLITLAYTLVRLLGAPLAIPLALVAGGLVQMGIIAAQLAGTIATRHLLYAFTGSFPNPGPLGGYLALSAICAAGLSIYWFNRQKRRSGILAAIAGGVLCIGVYAADSRAAWLALAMGGTYLALRQTRNGPRQKYIRNLGWISLPILFICLGYTLYHYKPDSANGRLLIWRVSMDMIADQPVTGHGIGSFPENYMYYQAGYFRNHPDSPAVQVADNTIYPFNEGVRMACEAGIIGIALALLVLLSAFWDGGSKNPVVVIYRSTLLGWLVFSCFSYPADVLPSAVLFALLMGGTQGKAFRSFTWTRAKQFGLGAIFVGFIGLTWVYDRSDLGRKQSAKHRYHQAEHLLKDTRPENLPELERIVRSIPTSENYTRLGESYVRLGDTEQAKRCFTLAFEMVPNRIVPRYRLFQLWQSEGRSDKAIPIAREILKMQPKAEGTATLRIRSELLQFLGDQE